MEGLLYNPVYNALTTRDAPLSLGEGEVKYFDSEVSPFAGFHTDYDKGFDDLYDQLPVGRTILYATPEQIDIPKGWKQQVQMQGLQFVFPGGNKPGEYSMEPVPLGKEHIDEMLQLATLTKPGPFGRRTIEFGHYHGIFENGQLAAMTGQRLHVGNHSEISAVCTHPDHLGKGFAAALLVHQLHLIIAQGQLPFLHVRADNTRAIAIYERLGFVVNGNMNFYFMKRLAERNFQ